MTGILFLVCCAFILVGGLLTVRSTDLPCKQMISRSIVTVPLMVGGLIGTVILGYWIL